MSHSIAIELSYKPAVPSYGVRLQTEQIQEEVILAGAILRELSWQHYDLDLLDPEVSQWLTHNVPVTNPAYIDELLTSNIEQTAWRRVAPLPSKLNWPKARTFKKESGKLSRRPKSDGLDLIEWTALRRALKLVNSNIPFPNKYEECTAFLKQHWRNHKLIQKFFQHLGIQGSVEFMIEISLGPLGCAAGARYLGLALLALGGARKLTVPELYNLLARLTKALANPVVSNRASANLFLALTIGLGDKEEFIKPLTNQIAPQMPGDTITDSIKSFIYACE
jgi:hypothetical protein